MHKTMIDYLSWCTRVFITVFFRLAKVIERKFVKTFMYILYNMISLEYNMITLEYNMITIEYVPYN